MTKTEFRPFPDVPAEFNDDVARYLAYYWQGLDSAVVAEFLDVGGPWSMVLWGRPGTGKSMLAAAFSVLAGSAVQDYPQRRGMLTLGDATCRLRLSDEIVSGAFLLHGQTAVHVYSVPFDGEVVVHGYGRSLGTAQRYSTVWGEVLGRRARWILKAEGFDMPHPTREVTERWVTEADGSPGALVRHLAWLGR